MPFDKGRLVHLDDPPENVTPQSTEFDCDSIRDASWKNTVSLITQVRFEVQAQLQAELEDVRSQLKHQQGLIDRLLSQEPRDGWQSYLSAPARILQLGKGKSDKIGKSDDGWSPKGASSPRDWYLDGSPSGGSSPRNWLLDGSPKGGSSSPRNEHLDKGKGRFGKGKSKGKDKSYKGPRRDILGDPSQPKPTLNSLIPQKPPPQLHDNLQSSSLESDCADTGKLPPSHILLATLKNTDDVLVDHWSFRNSYWDAVAFLGNHVVFEFPVAAANFLLLIVNIIVQASFIVIVSTMATSSITADTIEGYHKWRTNIGDELQYRDPLTEQSLAARVCSEDASLHLSGTQSAQVENIRGYLTKHSPFNGPMMCTLAVLAWSLTVTKEFHALMDMARACFNLPLGKTVIISDARRLELSSLSKCRLYFILALVALRSTIAGTLLIIGIRYLTATISIEGILLNVVVLGFVLNIDELMFEALAPNKTRRIILLLKPLQLPKKKQWRGLDTDFAFLVFGLIIVCSLCLPIWLLQEMDNMRKAEDELCGGVQGFS